MAQINKPSDYFETVTWTGNGSARDITVSHGTEWIWGKRRDGLNAHWLMDIVRGVDKRLISNETGVEDDPSTAILTAFNSDGFSLGTNSECNVNGGTYVGWSWLAGGTASSNTDGSITSTVSANTTSGFSIVSYTGNGTDGATVGHGLTSPKLILIKARTSATPWIMYGYPNHPAFTTDGSLLQLDSNVAMADSSTKEASIGASTVTFVDAGGDINASGVDFVMYCFQEKKGFSKMGSYTGTANTDGPFIYLGFKPAFILRKRTDSTGSWLMQDNRRPGSNRVVVDTLPTDNNVLYPNTNDAELVNNELDILSNGFKLRALDTFGNASGGSYVYMAFAENPLVGTNNIPATAR